MLTSRPFRGDSRRTGRPVAITTCTARHITCGISQGIRVKFVYEAHRVKVKVTGAKKVENLFPQCKTSIGNNFGSIKHRDVKFACSIGYCGSNGVTAIFCHVTGLRLEGNLTSGSVFTLKTRQ